MRLDMTPSADRLAMTFVAHCVKCVVRLVKVLKRTVSAGKFIKINVGAFK